VALLLAAPLAPAQISVQVFDNQVLVQTRAGLVTALDAVTGATQWRANVGLPYSFTHPLTVNQKQVFVVSGAHLSALNRATGQLDWQAILPRAPTATPAADEERIYICGGIGRLFVFRLPPPGAPPVAAAPTMPQNERERADSLVPRFGDRITSGQLSRAFSGVTGSTAGVSGKLSRNIGPLSSALEAEASPVVGPQPRFIWDYFASARLEQPPLLTPGFVTIVATDGSFFTSSQYSYKELYRFQSDAPVSVPMGQYRGLAYVASEDFSLYALDIMAGRILWRFASGAALLRQPQVTDEDIYLSPAQAGLYRLQRETGDFIWRNPMVERLRAVNPKFVYAADRAGGLLVLDRARGTQLGALDTRDFVVPITNVATDRLFLGSNDGLLVCLHDRDYPRPLVMKSAAPAAPAKKDAGKPPARPPAKPPAKPKEDSGAADKEMDKEK
jgi:outer membrane protein assembly factor BamB